MRLLMRQSLLLAAKDTKLFLKDRFGLGFALLFPMLFIVGFSLALSDIGPEDEQLRFAVVTEEESGFSRQLIDALTTADDSGVDEWGAKEAGLAVEEGRIPGYVLFPIDFTQRVAAGEGAKLYVTTGEASPGAQAALYGFAQAIAGRIETISLAARGTVALEGPAALDIGAVLAIAERPPLASFVVEQVGDVEPFNASNFTLPGYLTMFVFFVAALGAESIARERQTQTLGRLMSNGVRRSSIITGKLLSGVYRGLMQLAVLWTVGILVFAIDFGSSPAAVIAVSLFLVLASGAFGVMLASMVKTVRSASSVAVLASLMLAPLGGSWWPLFIAPEWLQVLGKLTPHGWANDAFNKLMLFSAAPSDVILNMAALAAFAVAFFGVALLKFRLAPTSSP